MLMQNMEVIMQTDKKKYIRTSTSIPQTHYKKLETIAQKNKVSMAWVVRDAIEKYLEKIINKMVCEKSTLKD
jgi:predicted DNA-binding protein